LSVCRIKKSAALKYLGINVGKKVRHIVWEKASEVIGLKKNRLNLVVAECSQVSIDTPYM